jgi:hypothetical protein
MAGPGRRCGRGRGPKRGSDPSCGPGPSHDLGTRPDPHAHPHLHKVPFSAPTSLDIGSTAWRTSTQNDKSPATRLREAAPTAVQYALQQAGL